MFDENNTEKKFVGTTVVKKRANQNKHKISSRVEHNVHDIKDQYSEKGKTLFNTLRENMSTRN